MSPVLSEHFNQDLGEAVVHDPKPAIVGQDNRSMLKCDRLSSDGLNERDDGALKGVVLLETRKAGEVN